MLIITTTTDKRFPLRDETIVNAEILDTDAFDRVIMIDADIPAKMLHAGDRVERNGEWFDIHTIKRIECRGISISAADMNADTNKKETA